MSLVFNPGRFGFEEQDVRVEGSTISGGTSLSGIDDPIRADGGGFVVAEFSEGSTFTRTDVLAWRAMTLGMDHGAAQVIVHFCDPLHQPVIGRDSVPHSDQTPFSDDTEYLSATVFAETTAPAALRATTLAISIDAPTALLGGEWFSIQHPTWGWRAYQIMSIDSDTLGFRPPLREAVASGTHIEFDDPRCTMRLAAATSNALSSGRYTDPAISFVEDMRKPA